MILEKFASDEEDKGKEIKRGATVKQVEGEEKEGENEEEEENHEKMEEEEKK